MHRETDLRTAHERLLRLAGASLLHELTRPFAPSRGETLLAAVSGGADSVALLHLLAALAPGRGWRVVVATLDHGLRGNEGAGDRAFVEALAERLGVDCVAAREDAADADGRSPEEAARDVRRAFLLRAAGGVGAERIVLAHTADDQAETTLMRLARGAGLLGLGGMRRSSDPLWRPLLSVRRDTLRALLEKSGEAWREDSSNRGREATRNRVRLDALPSLERAIGPGVVTGLIRAADLARDDDELLSALAGRHADEVTTSSGPTGVELDRRALIALPVPLARRIVKSALERVVPGKRLLARHVFAVLELARAEGSGTCADLPGNAFAERRGRRIVIGRARTARREPETE